MLDIIAAALEAVAKKHQANPQNRLLNAGALIVGVVSVLVLFLLAIYLVS